MTEVRRHTNDNDRILSYWNTTVFKVYWRHAQEAQPIKIINVNQNLRRFTEGMHKNLHLSNPDTSARICVRAIEKVPLCRFEVIGMRGK